MATPLGHSLAGLAVHNFSTVTQNRSNRLQLTLLCIILAMAPDLDLIPGILKAKPVLYHGSITHSLGFALLVSFSVAAIYYFRGNPFRDIFKLCFLAYSSHLLLDFLGPDGRTPYGIPLFWPLSGVHFISPIPVLLGAHHVSSTSASTLDFIKGIFNFYNLAAFAVEIVLIVPFIFWGKRYSKKKEVRVVNRSMQAQLLENNKI
jgi:inner membrane protein